MFSMRIVTTDCAMIEPIPGLDMTYSEFRSYKIYRVPVIRIFGSTPAGQKCCMTIHGVFPYLYAPYDGSTPVDTYLKQFAASVDKAINVAHGKTNSPAQHVYKISLVSGIPFYGYHSTEQTFLKIFLYNPMHVRKVADLLLNGAIMNQVLQPHEAHIPYVLQTFIDYNLFGMNLIHTDIVRFRRPLPSYPEMISGTFLQCKSKNLQGRPKLTDYSYKCCRERDLENSNKHKGFIEDGVMSTESQQKLFLSRSQETKKWCRENVNRELILADDIKRVSNCEIEVDVLSADILNRLQASDAWGSNPGLIELWEDEKQRRRDRDLPTDLAPPDSPDRCNVHCMDAEFALQQKFQEMMENLKSVSVDESHSMEGTYIKDTGQCSEEPVISEERVLQVTQCSQSFLSRSNSGARQNLTHSMTQDKMLAHLLASLADDSQVQVESASSQSSFTSQPLSRKSSIGSQRLSTEEIQETTSQNPEILNEENEVILRSKNKDEKENVVEDKLLCHSYLRGSSESDQMDDEYIEDVLSQSQSTVKQSKGQSYSSQGLLKPSKQLSCVSKGTGKQSSGHSSSSEESVKQFKELLSFSQGSGKQSKGLSSNSQGLELSELQGQSSSSQGLQLSQKSNSGSQSLDRPSEGLSQNIEEFLSPRPTCVKSLSRRSSVSRHSQGMESLTQQELLERAAALEENDSMLSEIVYISDSEEEQEQEFSQATPSDELNQEPASSQLRETEEDYDLAGMECTWNVTQLHTAADDDIDDDDDVIQLDGPTDKKELPRKRNCSRISFRSCSSQRLQSKVVESSADIKDQSELSKNLNDQSDFSKNLKDQSELSEQISCKSEMEADNSTEDDSLDITVLFNQSDMNSSTENICNNLRRKKSLGIRRNTQNLSHNSKQSNESNLVSEKNALISTSSFYGTESVSSKFKNKKFAVPRTLLISSKISSSSQVSSTILGCEEDPKSAEVSEDISKETCSAKSNSAECEGSQFYSGMITRGLRRTRKTSQAATKGDKIDQSNSNCDKVEQSVKLLSKKNLKTDKKQHLKSNCDNIAESVKPETSLQSNKKKQLKSNCDSISEYVKSLPLSRVSNVSKESEVNVLCDDFITVDNAEPSVNSKALPNAGHSIDIGHSNSRGHSSSMGHSSDKGVKRQVTRLRSKRLKLNHEREEEKNMDNDCIIVNSVLSSESKTGANRNKNVSNEISCEAFDISGKNTCGGNIKMSVAEKAKIAGATRGDVTYVEREIPKSASKLSLNRAKKDSVKSCTGNFNAGNCNLDDNKNKDMKAFVEHGCKDFSINLIRLKVPVVNIIEANPSDSFVQCGEKRQRLDTDLIKEELNKAECSNSNESEYVSPPKKLLSRRNLRLRKSKDLENLVNNNVTEVTGDIQDKDVARNMTMSQIRGEEGRNVTLDTPQFVYEKQNTEKGIKLSTENHSKISAECCNNFSATRHISLKQHTEQGVKSSILQGENIAENSAGENNSGKNNGGQNNYRENNYRENNYEENNDEEDSGDVLSKFALLSPESPLSPRDVSPARPTSPSGEINSDEDKTLFGEEISPKDKVAIEQMKENKLEDTDCEIDSNRDENISSRDEISSKYKTVVDTTIYDKQIESMDDAVLASSPTIIPDSPEMESETYHNFSVESESVQSSNLLQKKDQEFVRDSKDDFVNRTITSQMSAENSNEEIVDKGSELNEFKTDLQNKHIENDNIVNSNKRLEADNTMGLGDEVEPNLAGFKNNIRSGQLNSAAPDTVVVRLGLQPPTRARVVEDMLLTCIPLQPVIEAHCSVPTELTGKGRDPIIFSGQPVVSPMVKDLPEVGEPSDQHMNRMIQRSFTREVKCFGQSQLSLLSGLSRSSMVSILNCNNKVTVTPLIKPPSSLQMRHWYQQRLKATGKIDQPIGKELDRLTAVNKNDQPIGKELDKLIEGSEKPLENAEDSIVKNNDENCGKSGKVDDRFSPCPGKNEGMNEGNRSVVQVTQDKYFMSNICSTPAIKGKAIPGKNLAKNGRLGRRALKNSESMCSDASVTDSNNLSHPSFVCLDAEKIVIDKEESVGDKANNIHCTDNLTASENSADANNEPDAASTPAHNNISKSDKNSQNTTNTYSNTTNFTKLSSRMSQRIGDITNIKQRASLKHRHSVSHTPHSEMAEVQCSRSALRRASMVELEIPSPAKRERAKSLQEYQIIASTPCSRKVKASSIRSLDHQWGSPIQSEKISNVPMDQKSILHIDREPLACSTQVRGLSQEGHLGENRTGCHGSQEGNQEGCQAGSEGECQGNLNGHHVDMKHCGDVTVTDIKKVSDNNKPDRSIEGSLSGTLVGSDGCTNSQIDGPSLKNTYGFRLESQHIQKAKSVHLSQHITTLSLEVHAASRSDMKPDPDFDPIRALFYSIEQDVACTHPNDNSRHLVNAIVVDSNYITGSRGLLNSAGRPGVRVVYVNTEVDLFEEIISIVLRYDPDILMGFEIQKMSWGFLIQRASHLNIDLCKRMSRLKDDGRRTGGHVTTAAQDKEREEEGGEVMSEINIPGRIVLNLWRLLRHEVTLNRYSFENIYFHVLHLRTPEYSYKTLSNWWDHQSSLFRWRTVDYYVLRCAANLEITERLDLIGQTSEFARIFGIEFYEVLSRGSQFRVESMMLRLAKPGNFIAVSPGIHQRARMKSPECIQLNLEPRSEFYSHPVVVLDFQSLYPSIMIAYNYCFSTCLGRIQHLAKANEGPFEFGCTTLTVSTEDLKKLENDINICPNGVVFVKQHIRKGILSRMVEEILDSRLMVKKAMQLYKDDSTLTKLLYARQLGLKLIANVTFGYTAAHFSGRMPCVEVGDSIVRKSRETLERAIRLVESTPRWAAEVVYGDTDSMFVLLKGRTKDEAFTIGQEIADAVTADNPKPVKLRFEKVYLPCILQTKKRYVGFMYETRDQKEPTFDAKGIETVRRDGCPAVSKILEKSLKILFTSKDMTRVHSYVQHQMMKVMEERVNVQDCVFAKEYRGMAGYKPTACVPALEIARRLLKKDRRAEPLIKERVPYVIVHGAPGLPLISLVRQPHELLNDPGLRLNSLYYVTKAIVPALNRAFSLLGCDVMAWFNDLPRLARASNPGVQAGPGIASRGTISRYFASLNCPVCDELTNKGMCDSCSVDQQRVARILGARVNNLQRANSLFIQVCSSCMGCMDKKVSCESLDCPIMFKRIGSTRQLGQTDHLLALQCQLLDL